MSRKSLFGFLVIAVFFTSFSRDVAVSTARAEIPPAGNLLAVRAFGVPQPERGGHHDWRLQVEGGAKVKAALLQEGSTPVLSIRVIDPGRGAAVYVVANTALTDRRGPQYRSGAKFRHSVQARVLAGKGMVRALWGTYSLHDAYKTEVRNSDAWFTLERVSPVLDYRKYPRFYAIACYPTAKGETFQIRDPVLSRVPDNTPVNLPRAALNWPEIKDAEAAAYPSRPGNIIYDSGFNGFGDTKWWPVRTHIKEDIGRDGSRGAAGYCYGDYVRLIPGRPYTLSAYLRADKPTEVEMMVLHARVPGSAYPERDDFGTRSAGFRKKIRVGKKWQRYHGSFIAGFVPDQLDLDSYYVLIKAAGIQEKNQSNLHGVAIDNVQLEEGSLRPYVPRSVAGYVSVERNAVTEAAVFYPAEEIRVHCRLTAAGPMPAWAEVIIVDYYGRETARKRKDLSGHGDREVNWFSTFRIKQPGVYRALVRAPGMEGGKVSSHLPWARSSAVTVVSRKWEGSNRIACAQYIGSPLTGGYKPERQYTLARMLGVSNSRVLVKWKEVEEREGVFDYTKADREIAENMAWGLKPWLGLDDIHLPGDPAHAGASVPIWLRLKENSSPRGVAPDVLVKWGRYVRRTVTRYKDRIDHFECLNEPSIYNYPKVYMDFLKTMHREVKGIDPALKVMGPSSFLDWEFGKGEARFLASLAREGLGDYLDVFTFHHYELADGDTPAHESGLTAPERYHRLKQLLPQIDERRMPLWSNEYALRSADWLVATDGRTPPVNIFSRNIFGWESEFDEAVNYAVKDVVIGYYHGVRLFSPHILFAGGFEDQKSVWPQHGIGYGWYLKPDTVAFAAACARFSPDTMPFAWFKIGEAGSAYIFRTEKGAMASIFTVPHAAMELSFNTVPEHMTIQNIFGADYPWVGGKAQSIAIKIGAEPVFINLYGKSPYILAELIKSAAARPVWEPRRNNYSEDSVLP